MPEVFGHAPLLLGLLLNNQNNNRQEAGLPLLPGTVVVHGQIAEANYLCGTGELDDFSSFHLLLLDNHCPFFPCSLFCAHMPICFFSPLVVQINPSLNPSSLTDSDQMRTTHPLKQVSYICTARAQIPKT